MKAYEEQEKRREREERDECRAVTRCLRCKAPFRCGMEDDDPCWCTSLPRIDPAALVGLDAAGRAELGLPAGPLPAACLCPSCLAMIAAALAREAPLIPTPSAATCLVPTPRAATCPVPSEGAATRTR